MKYESITCNIKYLNKTHGLHIYKAQIYQVS